MNKLEGDISAPLWWQNTIGQAVRARLRAMDGALRIRAALRFASRWTISTNPTVSVTIAIGLTTDTCRQASRVRMPATETPFARGGSHAAATYA